ncbi:putative Neuropeptides capa receptor [Hypsibius exemplaris]|uniref:Neuropeptides capa receptor n=1 Tax=Hypsibius exemplaris TaxID=2072580 RepID=A0A1W0WW18_HYPEX|nr:putative Neuropeptides capa receptor [Hypsibius exemplaris]
MVWHQYPYMFPEFICSGRALISEMTTNASILTITAFTIERYIAICHPFYAQAMSTLSRTKRVISLIWLMALAAAAPFAHFLRIVHLDYPGTTVAIPESANCNIPTGRVDEMSWLLIISSSIFFILPLTVLSVLYICIAVTLNRSAHRFDLEQMRMGSSTSESCRAQSQSRRSIVRMLFFVCLAFFVCWCPFHAQRLYWATNGHRLTGNDEQTQLFHIINGYLYTWAGYWYYSNSVINVGIYNLMSHRFRDAFWETIYRSTCFGRRAGRDIDYAQSQHHSHARQGPGTGGYRRQSVPSFFGSTVPSVPPSRRASHMSPANDNIMLELRELSQALDRNRAPTKDPEPRRRQSSNDSGFVRDCRDGSNVFDFPLITARRQLVRMRQVSENRVFAASSPSSSPVLGIVDQAAGAEQQKHLLGESADGELPGHTL